MTGRLAAAQRLSDLARLAYCELPCDGAFRDPAGNLIHIQELTNG